MSYQRVGQIKIKLPQLSDINIKHEFTINSRAKATETMQTTMIYTSEESKNNTVSRDQGYNFRFRNLVLP